MALPNPTIERVEAWLKSKELVSDRINNDTVLRVGYDEIVFFIALDEPFISVTAMWMPDIVEAEHRAALELASSINRDTAFPKTYVHDNSLVFFTAVPVQYGISDEQLTNYLDMSFAVVGPVLSRAEEALPLSLNAHTDRINATKED